MGFLLSSFYRLIGLIEMGNAVDIDFGMAFDSIATLKEK